MPPVRARVARRIVAAAVRNHAYRVAVGGGSRARADCGGARHRGPRSQRCPHVAQPARRAATVDRRERRVAGRRPDAARRPLRPRVRDRHPRCSTCAAPSWRSSLGPDTEILHAVARLREAELLARRRRRERRGHAPRAARRPLASQSHRGALDRRRVRPDAGSHRRGTRPARLVRNAPARHAAARRRRSGGGHADASHVHCATPSTADCRPRGWALETRPVSDLTAHSVRVGIDVAKGHLDAHEGNARVEHSSEHPFGGQVSIASGRARRRGPSALPRRRWPRRVGFIARSGGTSRRSECWNPLRPAPARSIISARRSRRRSSPRWRPTGWTTTRARSVRRRCRSTWPRRSTSARRSLPTSPCSAA